METQLSENMQVAVLDPEQFGGLIKLPTILKQNQDLAARAVGKVSITLEPIKQIDLATVDAHTMETHDITLADIQARLKDAYDIMEGRRKPATGFMDQVKSMFTAEEKKITTIGAEVKTLRDSWQREKARRSQEAQQARDNDIAEKQKQIRERAEKES
ncbi:MAG TPA: hypothetical protein VK628_02905, partial [Flavitalea sp.]|nr:hypothetical protein [Flavitalea sp.]